MQREPGRLAEYLFPSREDANSMYHPIFRISLIDMEAETNES